MADRPDWYGFQESIRALFVEAGFLAETNKRIKGVRTNHDIDIYVSTPFFVSDLQWLVEAKHWNSKITKLHVLGLRTIVEDIGADRGIIVSKQGFQAGALEASEDTNISLLSFDEIAREARNFSTNTQITEFGNRVQLLLKRYWSHSKRIRVEYNLRHDHGDLMIFSINAKLNQVQKAIELARQGQYPIKFNTGIYDFVGAGSVTSFAQLSSWIHQNLNAMDIQLSLAEMAMYENGDYKPDFSDSIKTNEIINAVIDSGIELQMSARPSKAELIEILLGYEKDVNNG